MAITPYLLYRDAGAAVDWLGKAFGISTTRDIFKGQDGRVSHAYARAVKADATIIEQPRETPYGARRYGAEDLEGHRWYVAQELAPERRPARKGRKAKKAQARSRRRSRKS